MLQVGGLYASLQRQEQRMLAVVQGPAVLLSLLLLEASPGTMVAFFLFSTPMA
jgi:hypothetical protein